MTRFVDKIAFLVHDPVLWTHYSSVWKKLGRDQFSIALTPGFRTKGGPHPNHGIARFLAKINDAGYDVSWTDRLIRDQIKYRFVVSNHKIGGSDLRPASVSSRLSVVAVRALKHLVNMVCIETGRLPAFALHGFAPKQYWPLQIGETQVRFMYGADVSDGWSLAPWNEMYDFFLCHGPNDEEQVSKRFKGRTFQMGYPRYDSYFHSTSIDTAYELNEFQIDRGRLTVLWMPTFGEGACSIPYFAEALAPIKSRYNLIVRPHPLSFRRAPEDIERLRSLGYLIDDDPTRDMNRLYRITDAVLCDYGGSAFGALYLGKRMILLDVPGAHAWYTVKESSNLELCKYYPVLNPADVPLLPHLLEDDEYWDEQSAKARQLADKYFADFRGNSADRAANILLSLKEARPSRRQEIK